MTTSDSELIEEARQFTDYTSGETFSDSDLQSLVDTAKDEIRSHLGAPNFTFYRRTTTNTYRADRALFWFTCIGIKVRDGTLGNIDLVVDNLEAGAADEDAYNFWFRQFEKHITSAPRDIPALSPTRNVSIERDGERTYGNDSFG